MEKNISPTYTNWSACLVIVINVSVNVLTVAHALAHAVNARAQIAPASKMVQKP